jgi:NADH dehydrogenase
VTVRCSTIVTDIQADHVTLKHGDQFEQFPTSNILWAAGVKSSPLSTIIADTTGAQLDRAGRVIVQSDLSLPGYPDLFVIGDMANYTHNTERPLPGVAPVAMQQGGFVSKLIRRRINGRPAPTFQYRDLGNLATIGRWAAVADFGWLRLSGFSAWFLWLVVHLMNIVSFRNQLLVTVQWGWTFLSNDRSARLITGEATQKGEAVPVDTVEPHSSHV